MPSIENLRQSKITFPQLQRYGAKVAARLAPHRLERRLENPFLLIGCGRSGSTVTLDLLSHHPEIAAYPSEANWLWFPGLYPWAESQVDVPPVWVDPEAFTREALRTRTDSHDRRARATFGGFQMIDGGRCFLNKNVMISFMLERVRETLPAARFIHLFRDGRAVAYSYAKKKKQKISENPRYEEENHAYGWEELLRLQAKHWQDHILAVERAKDELALIPGQDVLEIAYEDLCRDTESSLTRIAEFMGIDPERYPGGALPELENRNHKFRSNLTEETQKDLEQEMSEGLELKGYL